MGLFSSSPPSPPTSGNPASVKFSQPAAAAAPPTCPVKGTGSIGGGAMRDLCPVLKEKKGGEEKPEAAQDNRPQYNVYSQPIDPKNNMPVHANNLPSFNQRESLPTERVQSTIPKGNGEGTWTYPSPQMFWNSINRKNKVGDTEEKDIPAVIAIHNNMNEKTWRKVEQWEKVLDPDGAGPKLLKFIGRPTDLSPKARLRTFFGYPLPFDRHDWTVQRPNGDTVRYVIDYYMDDSRTSDSKELPSLHDENAVQSVLVDVRPAADDVELVALRAVLMPLARMRGETKFEQLPFLPTPELKRQAGEAKVTWDNIVNKTMPGSEKRPMKKEEVDAIGRALKDIKEGCVKAQKAVDDCKGDADCARASLALTMCMAKFVCPLQHEAVMGVLEGGEGGEEGKLDVSLENMVTCIGLWDEKVKEAGEAAKIKK